ncbi:putative uncharacterized protein [Meiothermus ruber H328]|nr:putative uncharacterized protein [Meiothermus ruber H328]
MPAPLGPGGGQGDALALAHQQVGYVKQRAAPQGFLKLPALQHPLGGGFLLQGEANPQAGVAGLGGLYRLFHELGHAGFQAVQAPGVLGAAVGPALGLLQNALAPLLLLEPVGVLAGFLLLLEGSLTAKS